MKILKLLSLAVIGLAFCSCESDNGKGYEGQNALDLKFVNSSGVNSKELLSGSEQTDTVEVFLTAPLKERVNVALQTSAKGILNISPSKSMIMAGKTSVKFAIKAETLVPKDTTIMLSVETEGMLPEKVMPTGKKLTVVVKAREGLSLSQRDIDLINAYKKNYQLDLTPLLGQYTVTGKVIKYGSEAPDTEHPFKINGTTSVSISPLADEQHPILAMTQNAFGLSQFFGDTYAAMTIKDKETWTQQPAPQIIMKALNWTAEKPGTFDVAYYTLEIDPQTKMLKKDFLKTLAEVTKLPTVNEINQPKKLIDYTDNDIKVVPFVFNFSPWEACINYLKNNPKDMEFKDALIQGSVSPYQILYTSRVDKDDWENDKSNFVAPMLTLDWNKKTIMLKACADNANSGGYDQINVTMTKAGMVN